MQDHRGKHQGHSEADEVSGMTVRSLSFEFVGENGQGRVGKLNKFRIR